MKKQIIPHTINALYQEKLSLYVEKVNKYNKTGDEETLKELKSLRDLSEQIKEDLIKIKSNPDFSLEELLEIEKKYANPNWHCDCPLRTWRSP